MREIKNTYVFLILMVISLLLVACSKSDNVNDDQEEMDSKKFFEKLSIPDELSIDFDLDQVKQVKETKSYKARPQEFDMEELVDLLIESPIVEENIWAEGPQVIASEDTVDEILNISDGGKAFGVDSNIFGFTYSKAIEGMDTNKLNVVANVDFNDASLLYDFHSNNDYLSKSDLDFLPFEDVRMDVESALKKLGISTQVDETYSLDVDTMLSHYESYPRDANVIDEELTWTKEDEVYLFSMQQLIEDIPIINREWQMPDGTKTSAAGSPMKYTPIHLVYDQTGFRNIYVNGTVTVTGGIENHSLISHYEALEKLIEAYSQTILEEDVSIFSAELNYLPITESNEDNLVKLIPGWVFRSTKTSTYEGLNHTEYKTDVVNAITGELYQNRW